jgi:hypothetical protein
MQANNKLVSVGQRMKMIRNIVTILLVFGTHQCSLAQIEIMKEFDLGAYRVGFKHETVKDYSRSYGDDFRPVELFIWYPSNVPLNSPISYSEYVWSKAADEGNLLANQSPRKEQLDALIRSEIAAANIAGNPDDTLSKYKKLKTIAQREVEIADESFPVILFAPGGTTSGHLHSALCEYLASHGSIVVAIPALGNSEGIRWPFDQTGLDMQINDMAFALNHLIRSTPQANAKRIGLIAWSVGGVAQAIYCAKNPGIDLLISLDAGVGRTYGVDMLQASPHFNYRRMKIPFLHLTGTQPERFSVPRSSKFVESIASKEKHSLIIEPFSHHHFTSQLGLIPALISEKEDKIKIASYVHMCVSTSIFVDAFLKEDPQAKQEWLEMVNDWK